MVIINPTMVNGGNQISGGKRAEELREHILVSRGKATTPALRWALFQERQWGDGAKVGEGRGWRGRAAFP